MKILISSCLLGQKVRYDGKDKFVEGIEMISRYHEIFAFCPEVAGGLLVPREPSEIKGSSIDILKNGEGQILTISGKDVTKEFLEGAGKALNLVVELGIEAAVLKENSPSCGSTHVYDGTFNGNLIEGTGLTAQLLINNGIKVYTENNFHELLPEECEYTIEQ